MEQERNKERNEKPIIENFENPITDLTREQKLKIIVTQIKATSENATFLNDLMTFLSSRYHVVPTSQIRLGDRGFHYVYFQIFEER